MIQSAAAGRSKPAWLALGPASRLVGVDPDTLRRWADSGRVEAWTTPGGHRRFSRPSLERLLGARRQLQSPGTRPRSATQDTLAAAYRRAFGSPHSARAGTDASLPLALHDEFRDWGRRLIEELSRTLDAGDAAERRRARAEASALAGAFGSRLAEAGFGLSDAVALFVSARRPLLAELARTAGRRALPPGRAGALIDDASAFFDRLLLRFITAHREVRP